MSQPDWEQTQHERARERLETFPNIRAELNNAIKEFGALSEELETVKGNLAAAEAALKDALEESRAYRQGLMEGITLGAMEIRKRFVEKQAPGVIIEAVHEVIGRLLEGARDGTLKQTTAVDIDTSIDRPEMKPPWCKCWFSDNTLPDGRCRNCGRWPNLNKEE